MGHAISLEVRSIRPPTRRDWLLFYLGLPILYALWLTGSGIRLVSYMPFFAGFVYMSLYCLCTWWATDLGCRAARRLWWRRDGPLPGILLTGFALTLVPMGYVYTSSAELLARHYPEMAPFTSNVQFSWSLDYVLHFARYSVPWLATWIAIVYGYRFFFGVSWYEKAAAERQSSGQPRSPSRQPRLLTGKYLAAAPARPAAQAVPERPHAPAFLTQSRLPDDARILAISAAEHYIRVWTDQGADMIRYRFRDAVNEMKQVDGMQVHRSWWVDRSSITRCRTRGRSLSLTVQGDIEVPVSLAHREQVASMVPRASIRR